MGVFAGWLAGRIGGVPRSAPGLGRPDHARRAHGLQILKGGTGRLAVRSGSVVGTAGTACSLGHNPFEFGEIFAFGHGKEASLALPTSAASMAKP